jgi:hypothetical protein
MDNNKTISIKEDAKIKDSRGAWQNWIEVDRIGFILRQGRWTFFLMLVGWD